MTDPKQPKEFWITGLNDYDKIIFDQYDVKTFKPDFNADGRYVHVIEYSAYEDLKELYEELAREYTGIKTKHERVLQALEIAKKQLEGCRGAMAYAYEDHCDQYYLNVAENIIETIAQIESLK